MPFDRPRRDVRPVRDLGVRVPGRHRREHLPIAVGQHHLTKHGPIMSEIRLPHVRDVPPEAPDRRSRHRRGSTAAFLHCQQIRAVGACHLTIGVA
jgi:hypothetical protein